MKSLLFLTLLAMSLPSIAKDRIEKPTLLKPTVPFTPDGVVSEKELELLSRVEINKIEEGSLNGIHYRIYYTDGSGTFSGAPDGSLTTGFRLGEDWSTSCKKDPMDDTKSCYIQRKDLWVWLYPGGRLKIFIGGDQYPGTSASVRIDSNQAIRSPSDSEGVFTAAQSKQILQQLRSGARVATRYIDWPYRSAVDDSFDLHGFDEAYQYIQWALAQIR
ncbi:MAG TPA: hypothetical protein VM576_07440 [Xanthomonadaceae bacterium]|nr:hypothetical protein [Xanthomonadaceae bacterium]